MKLTLIGGGGVRSPLFVMSVLRWQDRVNVDELCLFDIDQHKLDIFGALCTEVTRRAGNPFVITKTTDPRAALTGADHVVTTIRVGFEQGRALDERIAINHGVLGQETTGPGGFAMALRSIPAILNYAALLKEVSPQAWMYNFTNPAGLVTQALREAGFERTIGICDGANGGQGAFAWYAGVPHEAVRAEVFGLNHLSWCRSAWLDGIDLVPRALADDRFVKTMQAAFDPALVRQIGMHLNEYLYYYHSAEKAVAAISSESKTRGEEIVELNKRLISQLEQIGVDRNPEKALRAFFGYERRRGSTYMHYAYGGMTIEEAERKNAEAGEDFDADIPAEAGEGYAGVALSIIEAMQSNKTLYTALNVANNGAISGMADDDVVEVSCKVENGMVEPLRIGEVPPFQLNLMKTIKLYERLTVQAIRERSRNLAVQALMVHPLVLSYTRAVSLVDAYLTAHAAYVGEWND